MELLLMFKIMLCAVKLNPLTMLPTKRLLDRIEKFLISSANPVNTKLGKPDQLIKLPSALMVRLSSAKSNFNKLLNVANSMPSPTVAYLGEKNAPEAVILFPINDAFADVAKVAIDTHNAKAKLFKIFINGPIKKFYFISEIHAIK